MNRANSSRKVNGALEQKVKDSDKGKVKDFVAKEKTTSVNSIIPVNNAAESVVESTQASSTSGRQSPQIFSDGEDSGNAPGKRSSWC